MGKLDFDTGSDEAALDDHVDDGPSDGGHLKFCPIPGLLSGPGVVFRLVFVLRAHPSTRDLDVLAVATAEVDSLQRPRCVPAVPNVQAAVAAAASQNWASPVTLALQ
jgi:hypothetical protein